MLIILLLFSFFVFSFHNNLFSPYWGRFDEVNTELIVSSATYLRLAEPTPTPLAEFDYDGAINRATKRAAQTTRSDRLPCHNDRREERRYTDRDRRHDDRPESSRAGQFHRRRLDIMSKDKYLFIYEYLINFHHDISSYYSLHDYSPNDFSLCIPS